MSDFTQNDYMVLLEKLDQLADEKYKVFHEKLVPNIENVKGVRSPLLKGLAKEIAKGDSEGFLNIARNASYEEIMLQGFVLGYMKSDIEIRLSYLEKFIPYITNWAVCDGTVANFKFKPCYMERVYLFLEKYLNSDKEYDLRVGCVFLMDYFINEEYIDKVLKHYGRIKSDKYYVNMAIAWGISVCFVKFREKTMEFLHSAVLDDFTYNKALQKIVESRRVDDETKSLIKAMKRK